MSSQRLSGKAAIVTGGGGGIGRAVCQLFAREGASVAVLDINKKGCEETLEQLSRAHGNEHCVIECDVTDSSDVRKAFETAELKLKKKCTVLVNCAGILRSAFLGETAEKEFDDVISVNVKGTFLMAREFVNSLKDSDEEACGALVNISSVVGKIGFRGFSSYVTSKSAVIGLTKTIALEFQKHKVRSNVILPGLVDTPMVAGSPVEEVVQLTPMRRMAKPEEVANAVLFLACEESSFVNGACLEVSGGHGL